MRKSYNAFKEEFDIGQATKKRAVIQLISMTMGGQKKFYNRWIGITEKSRLLAECKLVTSVFSSINYAIKSVTDTALLSNKN